MPFTVPDIPALAHALVRYYREEVIPDLVEEFDSWGFDAAALKSSADTFYAFLTLAAYDRRPFTYRAGYEAVWSEDPGSVRRLLQSQGLLRRATVFAFSVDDLRRRLAGLSSGNWNLAHDRKTRVQAGTDYAQTLHQLAARAEPLQASCLAAKDWGDVLTIHGQLDEIHGIGATIAAKIVKYLLREIRVAEVPPHAFARVARHLLPEFHNMKMLVRLAPGDPSGLGHRLATEVELLGEPLAIDALFHADRFYGGEIPAQFLQKTEQES
jgi:hypothetical protein